MIPSGTTLELYRCDLTVAEMIVCRKDQIRIDARGVEEKFRAKPVTGAKAVKSVVDKFREKYGARAVNRYYPKFDVAVVVHLT